MPAVREREQLGAFTLGVLRSYAWGMLAVGSLSVIGALLLEPPDRIGLISAVLGAVAAAVLRWGGIPLTKYAYLTMTAVPALVLAIWSGVGVAAASVEAPPFDGCASDPGRPTSLFTSPIRAPPRHTLHSTTRAPRCIERIG